MTILSSININYLSRTYCPPVNPVSNAKANHQRFQELVFKVNKADQASILPDISIAVGILKEVFKGILQGVIYLWNWVEINCG